MASEKVWLQARVQVSGQFSAQLESLMEREGALAITLTDVADSPVLEPGVGETPLWPEVMVTGLFDGGTPSEPLRLVLAHAPGVASGIQPVFSTLEDRDWERAWMDDFGPMKFGDGLWIVPGGQPAPDTKATVLWLDPGLAFGTGTHPTTRLCLEWIDARSFNNTMRVIDYGCGSGVLGVAAALKGAEKVVCVDHDPQALLATRENALRNGVSEKIETIDAKDFVDRPADVVLANILAGTLIELAPLLSSALKDGGELVLSGILKQQACEVSGAYKQWFGDMQMKTLEDWVLLSGKAGN